MYELHILILIGIIIILASAVQGSVGFGFALVAVPLLTFVLPIQLIVPLVVFYSTITNSIVVYSIRKNINIKNKQIWIMMVFGVVGIPLGAYALKHFNAEYLTVLVGGIIFLTSVIMFMGYKIQFKREKISYGVAGFISGIFNGWLSMGGPPVVLFLSNQDCNKDEFRGNLALYFSAANAITIIVYIYTGLVNTSMLKLMGINIITLIIGSIVGIMISKKIKEEQFKRIVLVLISVMGIITILKGTIL